MWSQIFYKFDYVSRLNCIIIAQDCYLDMKSVIDNDFEMYQPVINVQFVKGVAACTELKILSLVFDLFIEY